MYRTALKHEVSASEMQYLRDQGLTNKAIAERLDISPATVCRYLQPKTARLTIPTLGAYAASRQMPNSYKCIRRVPMPSTRQNSCA